MKRALHSLSLVFAIALFTACTVEMAERQAEETAENEQPQTNVPAESDAQVIKNGDEAAVQDLITVTGTVAGGRVQRVDIDGPSPVSGIGKSEIKPGSRVSPLRAPQRPSSPQYAIANSVHPHIRLPREPLDRENYQDIETNPVKLVSDEPVSTFSIDVDTGAYANMRRFLNQGVLPPSDAVRVEELINYFSYNYDVPGNTKVPFTVKTEIATAPWNDNALLLTIGIKGYEVPDKDRPPANLVFLIDVSGSMQSNDKLPLLKNAFRLMTNRLDEDDRVAMVVYAGATGLALESTPGNEKSKILHALSQLEAGGSTNGGAGIRLAYQVAIDNFIEDGINRVVLATDGDFNVGTVSHDSLIDLIERNRDNGVELTTLGFGQGNYNDMLLEQLANKGNGNYSYIDNLNEARKVLVEELSSTLQTIAKDVKIQIEFNPNVVAEYRLIGYENRMLRREDFNNDRIDAGEIGAGHTVTALYELKLVGSDSLLIDPLRYGDSSDRHDGSKREFAFLRLRYKQPTEDKSQLIEIPVRTSELLDIDETSDDFRFAAAIAAFGQRLRGGEYLASFDYDDIRSLAKDSRGNDENGYRGEFLSLVALADSLDTKERHAAR